MKPLAYAYEASEHCDACAERRFGRNEHDEISGTDNEGNEVGAIFEPFDRDMTCGTCLCSINVLDDGAD